MVDVKREMGIVGLGRMGAGMVRRLMKDRQFDEGAKEV